MTQKFTAPSPTPTSTPVKIILNRPHQANLTKLLQPHSEVVLSKGDRKALTDLLDKKKQMLVHLASYCSDAVRVEHKNSIQALKDNVVQLAKNIVSAPPTKKELEQRNREALVAVKKTIQEHNRSIHTFGIRAAQNASKIVSQGIEEMMKSEQSECEFYSIPFIESPVLSALISAKSVLDTYVVSPCCECNYNGDLPPIFNMIGL